MNFSIGGDTPTESQPINYTKLLIKLILVGCVITLVLWGLEISKVIDFGLVANNNATKPLTTKPLTTKPQTIKITLRGSDPRIRFSIQELNGNMIIPEQIASMSWTDITFITDKPNIIITRLDGVPNERLEIQRIAKNNIELPIGENKSVIRGDLHPFLEQKNNEDRLKRQRSINDGQFQWGGGVKYQIDLY